MLTHLVTNFKLFFLFRMKIKLFQRDLYQSGKYTCHVHDIISVESNLCFFALLAL